MSTCKEDTICALIVTTFDIKALEIGLKRDPPELGFKGLCKEPVDSYSRNVR